jgi:hypothetical protein
MKRRNSDRADREETGAGTRNSPTNEHLIRSTEVLSTACTEKVHSLIDKVYQWKLEMAWETVRDNRGSGGVDLPLGVSDEPANIGWPPQVRDWIGNPPSW